MIKTLLSKLGFELPGNQGYKSRQDKDNQRRKQQKGTCENQ